MKNKTYMGLDKDLEQGLGPTAKIILDARVFGLIDETETCEGWDVSAIQVLYDKVSQTWQQYGLLPSRLPDDLRARHTKIFDEAVSKARGHGWDPDGDIEDD